MIHSRQKTGGLFNTFADIGMCFSFQMSVFTFWLQFFYVLLTTSWWDFMEIMMVLVYGMVIFLLIVEKIRLI